MSIPIVDKNEEKQPNTSTSVLVLIVFGSVVVFILSFSSACAWVLLAKWLLVAARDKRTPIKKLAVLATALTLVTFGLALAFAFSTRHLQTRVPLDTSSLLTNTNLDSRGPPVHVNLKPATPRQSDASEST